MRLRREGACGQNVRHVLEGRSPSLSPSQAEPLTALRIHSNERAPKNSRVSAGVWASRRRTLAGAGAPACASGSVLSRRR